MQTRLGLTEDSRTTHARTTREKRVKKQMLTYDNNGVIDCLYEGF